MCAYTYRYAFVCATASSSSPRSMIDEGERVHSGLGTVFPDPVLLWNGELDLSAIFFLGSWRGRRGG